MLGGCEGFGEDYTLVLIWYDLRLVTSVGRQVRGRGRGGGEEEELTTASISMRENEVVDIAGNVTSIFHVSVISTRTYAPHQQPHLPA